MKIYSNTLNAADVSRAFSAAWAQDGQDIYLDGHARNFKPRKGYSNGVEFFAKSHLGRRPTGHRAVGSYPLEYEERAASWSAYGYVIARLFALDPDAQIGWYDGVEDFRAKVQQEGPRRRESTSFLDLLGRVSA